MIRLQCAGGATAPEDEAEAEDEPEQIDLTLKAASDNCSRTVAELAGSVIPESKIAQEYR